MRVALQDFGAVMAGASRYSGGALGGRNPAAAVSSTPLAVAGRADSISGADAEVMVRPHPGGGFTLARRVAGASAWLYSGNWPTARGAARALAAR